MSFIANLRMHLANLANFKGRETRGVFWPWVGLLFGLAMFVNALVMTQLVMPVMFVADTVDQMVGAMETYTKFMGVLGVVTVAMLAAAVTRRLHDAGKPAWLGLLPLPFLAFGLFWFTRIISVMFEEDVEGDSMSAFMLGFANNFIYIVMLGCLVFMLAQASNPDENRHGPPPNLPSAL
jgi:uncharacterized membrane protein YhaH (DUF805 family)